MTGVFVSPLDIVAGGWVATEATGRFPICCFSQLELLFGRHLTDHILDGTVRVCKLKKL